MFELIAILGLSAIIICCAVNLFELAFYEPDNGELKKEPEKVINKAENNKDLKEFIA